MKQSASIYLLSKNFPVQLCPTAMMHKGHTSRVWPACAPSALSLVIKAMCCQRSRTWDFDTLFWHWKYLLLPFHLTAPLSPEQHQHFFACQYASSLDRILFLMSNYFWNVFKNKKESACQHWNKSSQKEAMRRKPSNCLLLYSSGLGFI